ncbi:hypothetical protein EI546_12765 [Aequorivita sp. H23M31]|uniref:Lipocalin-like domain-containing protein n=1 Tax=Aequorivita ciconiae TaxID=2494375 RepID=A0A410G5I0_9FLAO|nr:lipocalin family protein [Aequorivita sp. H23M31]QAA82536.1 hypothetical protein EI546_12765 [Aequorivita sp. H23M31]
MKRLMSVFFIAVLFVACSSDDDNKSQATLVGSWTLVELNAALPIDFNNDGTANRNIMKEIPCYEGHASFTEDGNYLLTLSKVNAEIDGGIWNIECDGSVVNSGTYTLDGDQLTINPDNPDEESSTTTIDLNNNTVRYSMEAGDLGTVEFVLKRD